MNLTQCRAAMGREVIYTPRHGEPERGVITGTGHAYVFVRYAPDEHSKATNPADLTLAEQ